MALQAARSCRLSPRRGVPPPNLQAVPLNAAAAEPSLNQVLVVFVQSNQMRQLCPVGSRLRRAAVAWPQLSSSRKRSIQTSTVAMARVWRPDMNDVDRLSKGDGAKKRGMYCCHPIPEPNEQYNCTSVVVAAGTGNFNIPHRLNLDERPVYEAAKKKVRVCDLGRRQCTWPAISLGLLWLQLAGPPYTSTHAHCCFSQHPHIL